MTIKELNKLIKEELNAYLNEEQTDEMFKPMEPEEGGEDEALDTLRQIFNMLKPIVEPEEEVSDEEVEDLEGGEDEVEDEVGDDEEGEEVDEAVGYPNYRADQVSKVKADATDVNQGLNESFNGAARFKKLANIIK